MKLSSKRNVQKEILLFWQKKSSFCEKLGKVENNLKGSLDLIPSPSPSVEIQIIGGKVYLR